jgi:protein involved in polysaccharide export with SLBB domain
MKFFGRGIIGLALLFLMMVLAGCDTASTNYKFDPLADNQGKTVPNADPSTTLMHGGDILTISFADTPTLIAAEEDVIKEDGSITLIYNQKFQAVGKTVGQLQTEIRDRYVPQYFKYLTVTIKTQDRYYSVGGEVRAPNRQVYTGYMTVLRAIDTASGFTDFANKRKVVVTRASGKKVTVDCKKAQDHPELDVEIFPGDKIFVKKRIW